MTIVDAARDRADADGQWERRAKQLRHDVAKVPAFNGQRQTEPSVVGVQAHRRSSTPPSASTQGSSASVSGSCTSPYSMNV